MIQRTRRATATPPPTPDTRRWRRIVAALPTGDDATLARQLRVARAHVTHVRAQLAPVLPSAPPSAVPERLVALLRERGSTLAPMLARFLRLRLLRERAQAIGIHAAFAPVGVSEANSRKTPNQ